MKIAFDARYVRPVHHDGISRFSVGLVTELERLCAQRGYQLEVLISDPAQLVHLPRIPFRKISGPTSVREALVALQVNRGKYDVVFSPMQTMGSWFRSYKLLLTVHDLIYYTHPTPPPEFSWLIRLLWRIYHKAWWPQRILLNGADSVVAVSRTTAHLISEHRLTQRPVFVVYNAATGFTSAKRTSAEYKLSEARIQEAKLISRDLVYMGSFMPYKNVETLARAMHHLPGYTLHLLSKASSQTQQRLVRLAPIGSLVFHNGVSEKEYRAILTTAHIAVTASLNEGFGIPVIEAMSTGTPVVLSDIPIFHEVAGEAALFADPLNPKTFAQAVLSLSQTKRWVALSRRAMRRSLDFDWKKSAEKLLEAIEETSRS